MAAAEVLLREVAANAPRTIEVERVLCERAWAFFERGDASEYVRLIARAVEERATHEHIVLLAQASMARVAEAVQKPGLWIMSSPESGLRAAIDSYRASLA